MGLHVEVVALFYDVSEVWYQRNSSLLLCFLKHFLETKCNSLMVTVVLIIVCRFHWSFFFSIISESCILRILLPDALFSYTVIFLYAYALLLSNHLRS